MQREYQYNRDIIQASVYKIATVFWIIALYIDYRLSGAHDQEVERQTRNDDKAKVHQKIRHGTSSAWRHAAQKLHQLRRHVRRIHPQTALVGRRPAQRVEAAVPDESLVNDTKIGQMI